MELTHELIEKMVKESCRCIDAYKDRDLIDPECQAHDIGGYLTDLLMDEHQTVYS